jgi:hypothetical protein
MTEPDKRPVTMEELLVSSLAQTDALAKLLIEKGLITEKSLCRRFPRNGRRIQKFLIPQSIEHYSFEMTHFLNGLTLLLLRMLFEPRRNMATPTQTITTTRKAKFTIFTQYYSDAQRFLSNHLLQLPIKLFRERVNKVSNVFTEGNRRPSVISGS